jgi:hypothetical protein
MHGAQTEVEIEKRLGDVVDYLTKLSTYLHHAPLPSIVWFKRFKPFDAAPRAYSGPTDFYMRSVQTVELNQLHPNPTLVLSAPGFRSQQAFRLSVLDYFLRFEFALRF